MDPADKAEILEAIKESNENAFKIYNLLFENSIKGLSEQMGQFEERNVEQHKEICKKQDLTNGRVNCLEKETAGFRWYARNPKVATLIVLLILIGAVSLGLLLGFDNILGFVE